MNDIVGSGYSSFVYKGKDERNGEIVAIKVIDMRKLKNDVERYLLSNEI